MYKDVKEITSEQLEELKQHVFYDYEDMKDNGLEVDSDVEKIIEDSTWWEDIPDNVIYDIFSGFSFVNDDFSCSAGKLDYVVKVGKTEIKVIADNEEEARELALEEIKKELEVEEA